MAVQKLSAYICMIVFAFLACACTSTAAPPPDTQASKIIAVGDIHGDFDAYVDILRSAELVDNKLDWAGGETVFVQTGDIADRGPDTRKIIEHLISIQKQAKRKGGKVITLVGNHEAMNMTGDLRYVDPGEFQAFVTPQSAKLRDKVYQASRANVEAFFLEKDPDLTPAQIREKWNAAYPLGKIEHQNAWAPKGKIGKWVRTNPAAVLIDGNLFAHGGLSPKYSALSLKDMNKAVMAALKAQDKAMDSIINDDEGPLWYRGFIPGAETGETDEQRAALETVLAAYGAQRLIVGHTPSVSGIKSSYNGRLIQIDTGASKYYGGTHSFLRIENGHIYAHDNGEITKLN